MQLYELSDSELTLKKVESILPDTKKGIKRAIPLAQEMVSVLRERTDRAENRATIVLSASGVLSGITIGFSGFISDPSTRGWFIILGFFICSIISLVKSVLYALNTIDALRGYNLSPEASIKLSGMGESKAEKNELIFRIWEYYHLLKTCNSRLYSAQRSLLNFTLAVFFLIFTALSKFLLLITIVNISAGLQIACFFVLMILATFSDNIILKTNKHWRRQG